MLERQTEHRKQSQQAKGDLNTKAWIKVTVQNAIGQHKLGQADEYGYRYSSSIDIESFSNNQLISTNIVSFPHHNERK